jgi:hypothetical protein
MAAKGSKKNTDNFEKMKREMTSKRKTTKKQNDVDPLMINESSASEKSLIDDDTQHQQDSLPEMSEPTVKKRIEMVTFWIGEEEFALEISNVKEIIRLPLLTKVPNAPVISWVCVA